MAKNTFYSVKQTQGEQDPPNFDSVFTERFLLPRKVEKMCGIRHFRKTGMGRLRHLRRLRRFSPNLTFRLDLNVKQHPLAFPHFFTHGSGSEYYVDSNNPKFMHLHQHMR